MTEVHRQHIQWHDPSCSSIDVIQTPALVACLSCGSSGPAPPPALYLPLPDDSSVRLLQLLSDGLGDPIECRLRGCSLLSKPVFSAISYTWADEIGDDTKCEEIILDGQAFQVSRNCHTALKRVFQVSGTAPVWIDAICIDQSNTDERGHQVKLMSQIYLQAQNVFVYIGEHHSGSRNLFKSIEQTYQAQGHDDQTRTLVGLVSKSPWDSLFSRRYFSRVWILQELALAKHAVILCGDSALAWDHFANYSRVRKTLHKIEENSIFMFKRSLYLSPGKELFLLDHGRRANAADPRDKVYGLLGLLPAKRLGSIGADYTLSVEQLYVQVALEIAKLHGWKAVLDRAGTKQHLISSLPSWVPDWSFTGGEQKKTPNLESLQGHVVDKKDIGLKMIKDASDDGKWFLLDESKRPLNAYFFFKLKRENHQKHSATLLKFSKRGMKSLPARQRSTSRGLYLLLSTHSSGDRMTKSLCTTMEVESGQIFYVRLADAVQAFPLTLKELVSCAADYYILRLQIPSYYEPITSPSLVLDSFLDEYSRLSAGGPVEDWVLEAEGLWMKKHQKMHPKKEKIDDEISAANDAFWRLLVRRFALREQVVHIA